MYDAVEIKLKEDHVGDSSIMHFVSLLHPLLKGEMREVATAEHTSRLGRSEPVAIACVLPSPLPEFSMFAGLRVAF